MPFIGWAVLISVFDNYWWAVGVFVALYGRQLTLDILDRRRKPPQAKKPASNTKRKRLPR